MKKKASALQFEEALANCASEAIHQIGRIQPHSACLVFDTSAEMRVSQVSANIGEFINCTASESLGRDLASILGHRAIPKVRALIKTSVHYNKAFGWLTVTENDSEKLFSVYLYRANELYALELEKATPSLGPENPNPAMQGIEASLRVYGSINNQKDYLEAVASLYKNLTGYDSVMVYRFADDWTGEVIAQAREAHIPSYVGNRFPASDIPPQARELYAKNFVRMVADIDAEDTPIIPQLNPLTGQPLDMTYSSQRSLSRVHIEYLRNMGFAASVSISVMAEGELWGLITCHNVTPKIVPLDIREAAEFISKLVSTRLWEIKLNSERLFEKKSFALNNEFIASLPVKGVRQTINSILPQLQELFNVDLVLLVVGGETHSAGDTDTIPNMDLFLSWIRRHSPGQVICEDSLSNAYPEAEFMAGSAAGLLASCPATASGSLLALVRRELLETIDWAGKYDEGVAVDEKGDVRLSPRSSFKVWRETVKCKARPWTEIEKHAAALFLFSVPQGIEGQLQVERSYRQSIKMQEELDQARQRAEESAQFKSKFLARMSHEIRTPMNGIIGLSQLARDHPDAPETRDFLEKIFFSSKSLLTILNDILDYSKLEAGRLELAVSPFSLTDIRKDILNLYQHQAEAKGLELEFEIDQDIPLRLEGDFNKIKQIIANLVSNSLKFTQHGFVRVSVQNAGRGNELVRLRFRVEDSGIGVEEDYKANIFEAFSQGKLQNGQNVGTGLGLAICVEMLRLMNSEFYLADSDHGGAVFCFDVEFKICAESPKDDNREHYAPVGGRSFASEALARKLAEKRILVADDNEINLILFDNILRDMQCTVVLARNGAEALEQIRNGSFDAVIMDMQMPIMDGLVATQKIKTDPSLRHIPVIAVTAAVTAEELQACVDAGSDEVLPKPLDSELLLTKLGQLINPQ